MGFPPAFKDKGNTDLIEDTAYDASWQGDTSKGASKNALYNKIESISTGASDAAKPLHGIFDSSTEEIITLNADPALVDISAFDYYLNGTKYSFAGVTGFSLGFSSADDFRLIGLDENGIFLHTLNQFFMPADLVGRLELGGAATTDGSVISIIGNSHFNGDDFFRDIHLWGKFAKGSDFLNGAAKITKNTTPLQLDIASGQLIDPNFDLESVNAGSAIGLITNYHISGVWTLNNESAPYTVDNMQYDNGTDLVDMDAGKFATHTISRSSRTGELYLHYSQQQYDSFIDAINAEPQRGQFGDEQGTEVEYLAQIVIGKDETAINRIIDIRGYERKFTPFQTSSETSYDNIVSGLTADNVKSAIDELQADKASISTLNSNITLYPTTAAGDFTYNRLVTSPSDPDYNSVAVDVSVGPLTGADQLLISLIADAGLFEGGVGFLTIPTIGNIRKTGGGFFNNGSFYFEVYKRDIGGTETLIGTSSNTQDVSNSSYEQFSASALLNNPDFLPSDRVVIKYYGSPTGGGASPSFDLQFGGSQPTRTELPVPVSVTPSATALGTSYANSSSGLTADNVQQAIDEVVDNSVYSFNTRKGDVFPEFEDYTLEDVPVTDVTTSIKYKLIVDNGDLFLEEL